MHVGILGYLLMAVEDHGIRGCVFCVPTTPNHPGSG